MPVVSIWCITYNHVKFIREAVGGFLMQETTFPVEILIHDDASTDGTADIVRSYQAKYPQLFRAILQTKNQWSKGIKPRKFLTPLVRGQFTALCEGDDYWTDSLKLNKQVSAMNANPQVSASFHAVSMVNEAGDVLEIRPAQPVPTRLAFRDIVIRNHLLTCSIVYRSSVTSESCAWSKMLPMGDWPLQVNLARYGDLLGIDDNMGCYRRHQGGVWTTLSKREELKAIGEFYYAVRGAFKGSLPRDFYRRHIDHYWECFEASLHERRVIRACCEWVGFLWNRLKYFLSSANTDR